jgi:hypothetical protein
MNCYLRPAMKRPLQVYFDDAELSRLEAWAESHGWTKSQAVRAAVRALTSPAERDPLLELSGMVDGLPADLSERFDHHLNATFVAERPPPYGAEGATARKRATRTRVRR